MATGRNSPFDIRDFKMDDDEFESLYGEKQPDRKKSKHQSPTQIDKIWSEISQLQDELNLTDVEENQVLISYNINQIYTLYTQNAPQLGVDTNLINKMLTDYICGISEKWFPKQKEKQQEFILKLATELEDNEELSTLLQQISSTFDVGMNDDKLEGGVDIDLADLTMSLYRDSGKGFSPEEKNLAMKALSRVLSSTHDELTPLVLHNVWGIIKNFKNQGFQDDAQLLRGLLLSRLRPHQGFTRMALFKGYNTFIDESKHNHKASLDFITNLFVDCYNQFSEADQKAVSRSDFYLQLADYILDSAEEVPFEMLSRLMQLAFPATTVKSIPPLSSSNVPETKLTEALKKASNIITDAIQDDDETRDTILQDIPVMAELLSHFPPEIHNNGWVANIISSFILRLSNKIPGLLQEKTLEVLYSLSLTLATGRTNIACCQARLLNIYAYDSIEPRTKEAIGRFEIIRILCENREELDERLSGLIGYLSLIESRSTDRDEKKLDAALKQLAQYLKKPGMKLPDSLMQDQKHHYSGSFFQPPPVDPELQALDNLLLNTSIEISRGDNRVRIYTKVLPNSGGIVLDANVPADGHCLFYSVILGFLLPVLNDKAKFEQRMKLLGAETLGDRIELLRNYLIQTYVTNEDIFTFTPCKMCFDEMVVNLRIKAVAEMKGDKKSHYLRTYAKHRDPLRYTDEKVEIDQSIIEAFEKRLVFVEQSNAWGFNMEIEALSVVLGINIRVYKFRDNDPFDLFIGDNGRNDRHYADNDDSIVCILNASVRQDVDHRVEQTERDIHYRLLTKVSDIPLLVALTGFSSKTEEMRAPIEAHLKSRMEKRQKLSQERKPAQ